MLSVFPELLGYYLIGAIFIRLILGLLFLKYGIVKIFCKQGWIWKTLGVVELVVGTLLVAGLFTQVAAVLVSALMIGAIVVKFKTGDTIFRSSYDFYILIMIVSFAMLFIGPGIFALDLPL